MADVSKLRRTSRLGAPPDTIEASQNLSAPEVAPAASSNERPPPPRFDARSARRTNRTQQFATRVTPDWDRRIRAIAQREGLLLTEILERALDAYEAQLGDG